MRHWRGLRTRYQATRRYCAPSLLDRSPTMRRQPQNASPEEETLDPAIIDHEQGVGFAAIMPRVWTFPPADVMKRLIPRSTLVIDCPVLQLLENAIDKARIRRSSSFAGARHGTELNGGHLARPQVVRQNLSTLSVWSVVRRRTTSLSVHSASPSLPPCERNSASFCP